MKSLARNQRATYDYDIKTTFDAGLVLEGREVKSAKLGNMSLTGSYVTVNEFGGKLINCHIGAYNFAPSVGYDPLRPRSILLHKQELNQLLGKEKGTVLIPLEIYSTGRGLVKLKIGLGVARKKLDKRAYIKERDTKKEIRRAIG